MTKLERLRAGARDAGRLAVTLGVAALGGAAATGLGLPVGWLLGSTLAMAVASLGGLRIVLPKRLRDLAFFIVGVQAGSGVTPDVVDQLALWPLSFVIQMLGVVAVVAATSLVLQKGFGWDRETAFFASLPGALSFVIAVASETRADMPRVVILQSARLLLLIGVLTPTLAWLQDGAAVADGGRPVPIATLAEYGVFLAACLAGAALGIRLRVPGGLILGALLSSAVLNATELAPVQVPGFIALPGLVMLGAFIGARLRYEDRHLLPSLLPASLIAFAVGLAVSGLAGFAAFWALDIDLGRIALAYAPGALEALTVLAFQFDLDPAYVAAHHVVRFVSIALALPLLARRFPKRALTPDLIAGREAAPTAAAHDTASRGKDDDLA